MREDRRRFGITLGIGSRFALGSMPDEVGDFWVVVGDTVTMLVMIRRRE